VRHCGRAGRTGWRYAHLRNIPFTFPSSFNISIASIRNPSWAASTDVKRAGRATCYCNGNQNSVGETIEYKSLALHSRRCLRGPEEPPSIPWIHSPLARDTNMGNCELSSAWPRTPGRVTMPVDFFPILSAGTASSTCSVDSTACRMTFVLRRKDQCLRVVGNMKGGTPSGRTCSLCRHAGLQGR
jgi:hypothetical protein